MSSNLCGVKPWILAALLSLASCATDPKASCLLPVAGACVGVASACPPVQPVDDQPTWDHDHDAGPY